MKYIAILALISLLALSATTSAWDGSSPRGLGLWNASTLMISNVQSTEGWNITFQDGSIVPIESKNIDPCWMNTINIRTGKVNAICPMEWYTWNETYFFKDDGNSDLKVFAITNTAGVNVLQTSFIPSIPELSTTTVCNESICIDGYWSIDELDGCGAIIPKEVNATGEYLVRGEPTGYASASSSRPLEKAKLEKDLKKIQKRLNQI